jgi:hypothetical protein
MSGAIPPLPQYAFMAWCLVKAQGQLYLYLYLFLPLSAPIELHHLLLVPVVAKNRYFMPQKNTLTDMKYLQPV